MDSQRKDEIPSKWEGVRFASFGQRFLAFFLDELLLLLPGMAAVFFAFLYKNFTLFLLFNLVIMWYKPLMEGLFGATLGKMAIGLECVDIEVERIGLNQSVLKNAIYIIGYAISISGMYLVFQNEAFLEAQGLMESLNAQSAADQTAFISTAWMGLKFFSCIQVAFNPYTRQTWHDKLANTYCIVK